MADTTAPPKDYEAWTLWFPECIKGLQDQERLQDIKVGFDIAFFHGLQLGDGTNAHEKTWTNSKSVCWPRDLLPEALAPYLKGTPLRVLGISYNAQASQCRTGAYGVVGKGHERIAEVLFTHLVDSESCSLGGRPFVLVGHSYGGIAVRSLVVHCDALSKENPNDRLRPQIKIATRFMENLKGCIYFGVPLRGSKLANCASYMTMCIPKCIGKTVYSDLVTSSKKIKKLNKRFKAISNYRDVKQFAFGETKPTMFMFLPLTVVGRASAKGGLHSSEFMELPGTDHRTVNKFSDASSPGFKKFTEIVGGTIKKISDRRDDMERALGFNPQDARTRTSEPKLIPALLPAPEEDNDVAVLVAKLVALRADARFANDDVKNLFVSCLSVKLSGSIESLLSEVIEICNNEEIGPEPRMIEEKHIMSALRGDRSRTADD